MTLGAVLFDMDGTLVDTEGLWGIAIHELAVHYGGVLSPAGREAMLGASAETMMGLLHAELGQPWRDPARGTAWVHRRVAELLAKDIPWRPGARELLAVVRAAGVPTALVTNTGRAVVEVMLDTLGARNFDVVVCGDEVARAKPHPEPYLTAAAALRQDPTRCVAIEDSPTGIAAALAAGCAVIAVPNAVPLDAVVADAERARVIPSLTGVDLALLRSLAALPAAPALPAARCTVIKD